MSDLFDRHASTYGATVQRSIDFSSLSYQFFLRAKASILKEIANEQFGQGVKPSLLDVGCGVGLLHSLLADDFGPLSGVDSSAESIEQARQYNPQFEYRLNTGPELPYPSATFDIVTAICVVHHVSPAAWRSFISELKRVARPNGLVCLIEHNPLNPLTRLAVFRCPFDVGATLLTARRARQLLIDAGLAKVRSEHFLVFPSSSPAARAVERWLGALPLGAQYAAVGEC
jgi:2-polyprenyl-3-methyl-5-hydroxy-6-metoxy-1,4-benzoquinol methylase